jgi:hypothetical protein
MRLRGSLCRLPAHEGRGFHAHPGADRGARGNPPRALNHRPAALGGRLGRDLSGHNNRDLARCQRISVFGRTTRTALARPAPVGGLSRTPGRGDRGTGGNPHDRIQSVDTDIGGMDKARRVIALRAWSHNGGRSAISRRLGAAPASYSPKRMISALTAS